MRSKQIAIAASAAALAVTGTAFAAGGGPAGPLGDDRKQELAEDLASQLDGVNPNEVSEALGVVIEQRLEARRDEMAAAIAAELDGVGADAVAEALAKHGEQMRERIENRERPDPAGLVTTLSEELDKGAEEISAALEAAREARAEAHRTEALERLDAAVEAGEISEQQAEQIRERIESGERPGPGGPGHHGPRPGFGPGGPGFGPSGPGAGPTPEGGEDGEGAALSAPFEDGSFSS